MRLDHFIHRDCTQLIFSLEPNIEYMTVAFRLLSLQMTQPQQQQREWTKMIY